MESAAERRAHPVLFAFRRRGRYQQYQASDDAAVAIADPMSLSTTSCV